MGICQSDFEVETFAQALTCALNTAYPEAAPWTDPGIWSTWMREAANLVEHDLVQSAVGDGQSPRPWELLVWVRGRRELEACADGTSLCAARRMYPYYDWSEAYRMPWQEQLLGALTQIGHA